MPPNTFNDKSTSVQVMAWCCQATSHYLSPCWPRSMSFHKICMRSIFYYTRQSTIRRLVNIFQIYIYYDHNIKDSHFCLYSAISIHKYSPIVYIPQPNKIHTGTSLNTPSVKYILIAIFEVSLWFSIMEFLSPLRNYNLIIQIHSWGPRGNDLL